MRAVNLTQLSLHSFRMANLLSTSQTKHGGPQAQKKKDCLLKSLALFLNMIQRVKRRGRWTRRRWTRRRWTRESLYVRKKIGLTGPQNLRFLDSILDLKFILLYIHMCITNHFGIQTQCPQ